MDERYGRKVQGIKKTQQKIFKNIIIQNETKLSEEGKKKSLRKGCVEPRRTFSFVHVLYE